MRENARRKLSQGSLYRTLAVLALVLTIGLVFAQPASAQSRSFEFTRLDIEAEVLPDGTLVIAEHRTASFRGPFSGMYQWINHSQGVTVTEVVVEENGRPYEFRPGAETIGPANTYFIRQEPNRLYLDWSFAAFDETRTFTIRYRVQGEVMVHQDVAELYYQFVGQEWEQGVRNVTVTLRLPEGATKDELRAWGHGPYHGDVELVSDREIRWQIAPLPARTFLEGRVTFPTRLVTGDNARYTGREALPGILREEQAWANQANRVRWLSRIDPYLAGLTILGAIVIGYILKRRYGAPYPTTFTGDYYRELPGDYSPAEMSVLYRYGYPNFDDLTATILDLARRGYLRIEEQVTGEGKKRKADYNLTKLQKQDGLAAHEQDLLRFLFKQVGKETEVVSFDQLENYAKKQPKSFKQFWDGWMGMVRFAGEKRGFFDQGGELAQGKKRLYMLGGIAFILGLIIIVLLADQGLIFTGMAMFPASLNSVLIAAMMSRRSRQGEEDFARWRGFRRFLLHFSQMERHTIPSLVIWEHYLVYAVSLGVAKEVMKQLELVYPNLQEGHHSFGYGWFYFGRGPLGMLGFSNSLSSLSTTMNSALSAANTTRSSGGGGGGGFSGGGGFGGGGGGGGVR